MFAPVGTDDGVIFTAILETGELDFGAPSRTKYVRRIRILGRGDVTLQIKKNFRSAVDKTKAINMTSLNNLWNTGVWNTGNWGPDSLFKEALINPDAYGRVFQLRFTDSSSAIGRKLLEVGSREYSITSGEWGIYLFTIDADLLGVRD
jgi:hypothetical protein